ncbi:MAG: hypothetical protein ABIG68_12275 [Acidobacteriota bacterium]
MRDRSHQEANSLSATSLHYAKKKNPFVPDNRHSDQKNPEFRGGNIRYTVTEKEGAIGYEGSGVIYTLVRRLKLDWLINQGVRLLGRHATYHESDTSSS